ncbi:DUF927 domain-containing protein [Bradyrhizobium sp. TZ2]
MSVRMSSTLWLNSSRSDGRPHTHHVSDAALQGDPAPLCAALADDGLRINRSQQRHLVAYLSAANVHGRVTIVKRTGWHEIGGQSVFVLPDDVVAPHGAERILLDAAAAGPYEARGLLRDWQEGISRLASGHALPVLAVSAALAGPLLSLAGQDGGGLNFYGPSSIGKTTLLRAAASIWGRGDTPGYIRTWRATANGLEGAAASATDTALVLDELGQVEAREAAAALYSLSNGAGKARAARDGSLREPKKLAGVIPVERRSAYRGETFGGSRPEGPRGTDRAHARYCFGTGVWCVRSCRHRQRRRQVGEGVQGSRSLGIWLGRP